MIVGTSDPFSEFTDTGFRGFAGGSEATCGRSCEWFRKVEQDGLKGFAIGDINTAEDPALRALMTPSDIALFGTYCDAEGGTGTDAKFGFPGRGRIAGSREHSAEVLIVDVKEAELVEMHYSVMLQPHL